MKRKYDAIDMTLFIFLGLMAVISIFPFYQTVIVSFSKIGDIAMQKVFLYPVSFDFSAYKYLLLDGRAPRGFLVTVLVTISGTAVNMLFTTMGAYALSKKSLPGRNIIFNGIILTMFFTGGLVPYFLTIQGLHLQNNILVMILPVAVNAFNLIMMKNYFNTISPSLEESARLDGANDITILARIVLPVSAPMLAAITLFYAVDRWNEWWMAVLFINDTRLYPLQLVLRDIIINLSQKLNSDTGTLMVQGTKSVYEGSIKAAIIVISAAPILMVYPFLQRYFASGVMIGSIKG